ncbi:DUF2283 domain-containing protein [Pseudohongiella spirulinae]|jgi:uncharacterized protein YuzE|uniref:DUF2283 domain-containing protein n=1 Tax=Pseudohongiella spirulinae TaxID=1249552 RepID=A0A0S2KAG1_9GAMM|nr:DUF2283 domain-containing protein [Pseudohongiella spirulinae]ALO45307.1 hypothetical protein PS2015_624 [Pseudohongiella spirulinae]
MKMSYFAETDTLYIELRAVGVVETRDLDENTLADYDINGNIVAITMEHASSRTDVQHITLSGIAA